MYLGLLGSGIYLVSSNRTLLVASIALTVVISIAGVATIISAFGAPLWVQLLWGISLIVYQGLIITIMAIFIIESQSVTLEVFYSSVAIYFMLASLLELASSFLSSRKDGLISKDERKTQLSGSYKIRTDWSHRTVFLFGLLRNIAQSSLGMRWMPK